ncbi:MAG: efflux RND transporter periplasmic adaptor subunit [Deltaproteobacteria bacterium]|nr:efflux RND transporter periplasmic adaptor subunit [Deltaproteobacteria bacterium]
MKKYGLLSFVCFILALGIFLAFSFLKNGEASRQEYRLAPITKGSLKSLVSSTGTLNPINTVKVGSQVSGIIKEIYVDFNSTVNKGQVVALIDPAFYEAQVEQSRAQLQIAKTQLQESTRNIASAEASVQNAEAQLASSIATLKEAELRYERLSNLLSRGMVARSDLDTAQARRDNAKAAVDMSQSQIKSAKANLNRVLAQEKGSEALIEQRKAALNLAEIQLRYCTIKSPISGVVIERHVDVGQTVAASLQSPTLFTIAEDLSSMQVMVNVSEADVGQIAAGQQVEFTVDAFPQQKFKAEVRQIRNSAASIQNVVTYKIIADVSNDTLILRPGMTANVNIVTAEAEDVLRAPNAAFRFKPPGETTASSSRRIPPIRERETYKYTVKKLSLDAEQTKAYEAIIKEADAKLKQAYAVPEEQRDVQSAWRNYFTEIVRNLSQILKPEQSGAFQEYLRELKSYGEKRRQSNLRRAQVYILDKTGQPAVIDVMAGISDDSQTQIVSNEIKEGDKVIVGLNATGASGKTKSNPFSGMTRAWR